MKKRPQIAVVGAGLGGTVAAILLQRRGYAVTIYEQTSRLARIGAGINLGSNVMHVIRHLGLEHQVMSIGLVPETGRSRAWDTGRVLFERPFKKWAAEYGIPHVIMHRGDLLRVLAEALQLDTIHFGKRLIDLDTAGQAIQLSFDDGDSVKADIVIGADGVNSKVREILLGPEPPIYTGMVAYRAIFPATLLGDFRITADTTKWWSDERHWAKEDRHFIIYYLTSARDEVYFVTGSPDPTWNSELAFVPADIKEIKACYEGFHPEVQRVIDSCPAASKWPLLERKPLALWSRDGIVLLGDACHPMKPHMGQGAAMAIEDAAMLVRCLEIADDHASAFRLYEANRIERTSKVQLESHDNTWLKYETDPSWVFGYDAMTVPINPLAITPFKRDSM